MCTSQGHRRPQDMAEPAAWTLGAHRWRRLGGTASRKLPAARAGRHGTRATAASRRSPAQPPLCSPIRLAFSMVSLTLGAYVIRPCSPGEAAYLWTNPHGSVLEWEKRRIKSMGAAQKLQHSRPGIACTEACPLRHAFLAGLPLSPVPDD